MDELNLENERELLNSILCSSDRNVHEFNDIRQIFTTDNLKAVSHIEETNEEKIHTLFDKFPTSSVSASKGGIFYKKRFRFNVTLCENVKYLSTYIEKENRKKNDNAKEIIALESKCEELRTQIECQMKQKEAAFEEIERLRDQILNQSTYCTSLGAVLGNLTWRASRFPQIVDAWLSNFQNKIGEFLSIANGTFGAFVNTYRSAFPPTSNVEYQFVMGLLGIVSNISASPEGREFLIKNSSGTEFVQKLIKLTPELPSTSGTVSLKRLMLMILYNVSMNKTGLQYLLESRVGDVLSHCLDDKASSEEMQLLCLRVLQSITYDLEELKYARDLIAVIPIERIETMMSAKRSDISGAAKQVIEHLRHSQKITK